MATVGVFAQPTTAWLRSYPFSRWRRYRFMLGSSSFSRWRLYYICTYNFSLANQEEDFQLYRAFLAALKLVFLVVRRCEGIIVKFQEFFVQANTL